MSKRPMNMWEFFDKNTAELGFVVVVLAYFILTTIAIIHD